MQIKVLDQVVASRIAAGEVVDRPASALREFLDNSIDANADKITVYIEEGGIRNLTVQDNGKGMDKEDLAIACKSHATSKIHTLDDLFSLQTLGFRGEALGSIASCSTLTINSNGYSITVDNGVEGTVAKGPVKEGTTVIMENLFEAIPARKQFLKRPSTEASECRKVFIEKALGFESIDFRLFIDGELSLELHKASKKERILQILSQDKNFISADCIQMECEREPVKLYALSSGPASYKRDRSQIKIFINNRIIDCFPLVQAITTAYSVALPGGAFPYFYLFIEDSPSLVDFNIHPTKRECKIRNQSFVYATLTSMIRDALLKKQIQRQPEIIKSHTTDTVEAPVLFTEKRTTESFNRDFEQALKKSWEVKQPQPKFETSWFDKAKAVLSKREEQKNTADANEERPYSYIGQAFKTFLIAQSGESLLIIDQHAAHERILYDEIRSMKDIQMLMIPYKFETDQDVDEFLEQNAVLYQEYGIQLAKSGKMQWEITSIPATCRKNEKEIAAYIQNATGDVDSVQKGLFAVIACHSAIKAGDIVDNATAISLLDKVFKLDAMLCPHGRSFVFELKKEDLFREVGRTV